MQDPGLWAKLKDHPLPVEGARDGLFSRVLALGRLGPRRTLTALEAYRRFLYLAAIAGETVTPPPLLGQIWRLHALDHRNYAEGLVRGVIRRPMPDAFAMPLPVSDPAHRRTRALYRKEFGQTPPVTLWPGPLAMGIGRAVDLAVPGFAVLAAWLALTESLAWAAVAGMASLAFVAIPDRLTPWVMRKRNNEVDLDFGANDQGGGGLGIFGDRD
jgi:hypothetical protein